MYGFVNCTFFFWEALAKQRLLPSGRANLAFPTATFDWLFQGAALAFPKGVLRSLSSASQGRFERFREKEQPQEHSFLQNDTK